MKLTKRFLLAFILGACLLVSGPVYAEENGDLSLFFDDNEMVEATSRAPKLLNRTAENVTVVTAAEIERLNAHNIYEVLDRVPGISIAYNNGQNMNGFAGVFIQGSRIEHVLVLLDGVRFNTASSGVASFSTLPVGIIKRIEIIKGPASAAWGSSLGGVINILTKKAGTTATPDGSLFASYGEAQTWELNGDAAGSIGQLGYYLYAGHQETDGFVADRYFDNTQVYGKLELPLPHDLHLFATVGQFTPDQKTGDFPNLDFSEMIYDRHTFATINLNVLFSPNLNLNIGVRQLKRDYVNKRTFLGLGSYSGAVAGDLFYGENWEEESSGATANLSWNPANQHIALGGEINRAEVAKNTRYGNWAQGSWPPGWEAPASDSAPTAEEETWGVYLNDTITMGGWSVTPGIRYDHHSISESMTSPSLGVTYQLRKDTMVRAVVNQGFVFPVLSYLAVSDWAYPANPDLKPEKITSYQFGLETDIVARLHIKTNIFLHKVEDSWIDNYPWENGPDLQRHGFDLEIATVPIAGFSAVANLAFVKFIPENSTENDSSTTANLMLRYDDDKTLQAELACHYVWWDVYQTDYYQNGEYNTPIWDLRLTRQLFTAGDLSVKGFFTGHNLFNGSQYNDHNYVNPDRWLEAGLKFRF